MSITGTTLYWSPPPGAALELTAISEAPSANAVRRWFAIDQPTTSRLPACSAISGPLSNAREELAGKVVELQNTNRALQAENAEPRRSEELLRESEQRFRPLIDRSSGAAIMFDQREAILYASRPSERLPTLGDAKAAQGRHLCRTRWMLPRRSCHGGVKPILDVTLVGGPARD